MKRIRLFVVNVCNTVESIYIIRMGSCFIKRMDRDNNIPFGVFAWYHFTGVRISKGSRVGKHVLDKAACN